jgi:hypothetical protein
VEEGEREKDDNAEVAMRQGAWFDGPGKLKQLARELLWFPGMSVLEVAPSASSFELAQLLQMKFFHLEVSAKQLESHRELASTLGLRAEGALWEEREEALARWPGADALLLRNVCSSMDTLKQLMGKLSCPGSLLLVWPVRLQPISATWAGHVPALWTPNELLFQLRGLGFECISLECSPFLPEEEGGEAFSKTPGASTEKDALLAHALVAATLSRPISL